MLNAVGALNVRLNIPVWLNFIKPVSTKTCLAELGHQPKYNKVYNAATGAATHFLLTE